MGLEDDLARARRLVGGREPKELGDYLLRPLPGRPYLPGTAALDLSKLGSPSPEIELPDHFAFICLSEYLAASARDLFASDAPPGGWKRLCLRQHSRRDLLLHLVALNRLSRKPDQARSLEDWYVGQLPERAAVSYRNVKAQSSIPRQFLARQAILLAMRETMLFTEPVITPPEIPPFQAAVMLTHAIADELEEGMLDGPELWKDMPVAILMEVVSNALFNRSDDLVEKLDRHSRTWREAAAASTISGLPDDLGSMVLRSLGISTDEVLMHGLILDSHVTSWTGPEDPMVERDPFPVEAGFDHRVSTAFLDYVATSEGQLSNDLRLQTGRWAFLPFESSPVLRFDKGDYVVLDQQLLQDRITKALYWAVHDSEKRRSEASRAAFATGFGHVVEDVVRSDLRRIASAAPSIPSGPGDAYFSEDAIVAAYSAGGRLQGKKNADAAIWTPTAWLVVEIVNGALRIPTRQGGNLESFREDTLRLVLEKLEQLDSTAEDLLRAPQDLAGITNPPGMRIQPLLIQGGQFPVHPATIAYIDEEVRRRRLFSNARIKRLAILEAAELDLLESEVERGAGLAQLLDSWLSSERRAFALKNYVLSRRPSVNPDDHRPRRLQGYSRLKEILTSLPGGRLQTEQDEVRAKDR